MSWIENKYASLLSSQLERFKRISNGYNFRCPVCGDSQTNKFKARGYLLSKDNTLIYYCHNCNYSANFNKFLEKVNPILHKDYVIESFPNRKREDNKLQFTEAPKPIYNDSLKPLKKLKKISQLRWDHPVKTYILNRKIPNPYHAQLYYCPDFAAWVNYIVPGFYTLPEKDKRIIIPFIDKDGNLFGFQGRSTNPNNKMRYLTIMLDNTAPKVFGLNNVNLNDKFYVFEGPIDSMFINNSIAVAGSDIMSVLRQLNVDKYKVIVCYDNEPRSKEIVLKIKKTIDEGYNVCFWPDNIKQKDINDMVMSGMKVADIKLIIDQNNYNGLQANMRYNSWKKI
tara:strand:- start:3238 stop:4251 length:1014 start_codon:yes stop_codon:yes gene_type:complete